MYDFPRNEILLICDALNGATLEQEVELYSPQSLLGERVRDKIILDELDQKWGVARDDLARKLDALNLEQAGILLDSVKRYWKLREHGRSQDEALREAGLS